MSEHTESSRPASPPLQGLQLTRPFRFQWDSQRRGPESVSETTEGRGDYIASTGHAFNTSSLTLALGALPAEWSSSRHGFHAISTVLNNPHKSQAPPKAHSSLPTVPPADLPRVKRKDFDSYLNAIGPEWEKLERNARLGREGEAQIDSPSTPRVSSLFDLPSTPTSRAFDVPPTPRTPRAIPGRTMPSLDTVPEVFFKTTFDLGNPKTFAIVTEARPGEEDFMNASSLAHSLPLLEKFSHYADTVEQHLVREISLRSTSFFAALTNLHELQSESEQCLERIAGLRRLLVETGDQKDTLAVSAPPLQSVAKRGLQIVRKQCRLQNVAKVRAGVRVVSGVVEMTGVATGLVGGAQWSEALGVVEEMEGMWDLTVAATSHPAPMPRRSTNGRSRSPLPCLEESPPSSPRSLRSQAPHPQKDPPIPLSSLQAFASLPSHLRNLTMEIAASLSGELVDVLRGDLEERIGGSRPDASQRLRPLLQGLVRTRGLKEATLSWREVVMEEVKRAIQRHVPSFDTEEGSTLLRGMEHDMFLLLIRAIYENLLNGIEGLQAQGSMLVDIVSAARSTSHSIDISALQEELADILASAAEVANTQVAKVVTPRSDQHAILGLPEFLVFFDDSWNFVLKCEVLSRRMIVGLRGVVIGQAKTFLQTFHQARISRSAKLVEDELWNPSEISSALQHVVDILVDSAVRDSPELAIGSNTTSEALPVATPSVNGKTGSKHLQVEERPYFSVSATSEVLMLLLDYLRVIVNLPMLTTDTMSRVIEFLKAFNSRTCQVVLGAGAMRSAGLKNITAKHLALASQSLSIMIALIPYVRETFRRHLSQKQAVMLVEFDKLKRDFQEHQNEIHAKLIAIMGDRLSAHVRTLQMVDWNVPKPTPGPNDYMELLIKETVTLHKVLSRYLSTPVVEYVMTQVFAAINHRLSEEYGRIDLPGPEAKQILLEDARYMHQKLSALKNVGAHSNMLELIISEKPLPRRPSPFTTVGGSANQRIKGMLTRQSTTFSPLSEKPISPSPDPQPSPTPSRSQTMWNGNGNGSRNVSGSGYKQAPQSPLPPTPSIDSFPEIVAPLPLPPPPPRRASSLLDLREAPSPRGSPGLESMMRPNSRSSMRSPNPSTPPPPQPHFLASAPPTPIPRLLPPESKPLPPLSPESAPVSDNTSGGLLVGDGTRMVESPVGGSSPSAPAPEQTPN